MKKLNPQISELDAKRIYEEEDLLKKFTKDNTLLAGLLEIAKIWNKESKKGNLNLNTLENIANILDLVVPQEIPDQVEDLINLHTEKLKIKLINKLGWEESYNDLNKEKIRRFLTNIIVSEYSDESVKNQSNQLLDLSEDISISQLKKGFEKIITNITSTSQNNTILLSNIVYWWDKY